MYLDDLNTSMTFDLPEVSITKEQILARIALQQDYPTPDIIINNV